MPAVSCAGMNWPLKDACSSISFSWRRPSSSVMAIYACMLDSQDRESEMDTMQEQHVLTLMGLDAFYIYTIRPWPQCVPL